MSILGDRLAGARVLDLYAGSGALGLEALSRGAESAAFVELESAGADGARCQHRITRRPAEGHGPPRATHSGSPGRSSRRVRSRLRRPAVQRRCRRPAGCPLPQGALRTHSFRRASSRPARRRGHHPPVRRHRTHLLPRSMTRIAIYPGSFDPPTKGHEDLIRRSLALADKVDRRRGHQPRQAAALRGRGAAGHAPRRGERARVSRSSPSKACSPISRAGWARRW